MTQLPNLGDVERGTALQHHTTEFAAVTTEFAAVGLLSTDLAGLAMRFMSAVPRLCCKSRFALMTKNSAGHRRGFRVKM